MRVFGAFTMALVAAVALANDEGIIGKLKHPDAFKTMEEIC